ncbi:MAG: hypothetical protein GY754_22540 [bacterium]|nr:hypothetical protein [bacterium]
MIIQVLFGLISFVFTPIILLLFCVQSKHFGFKIGSVLLLALYALCLAVSYGNSTAGVVSFIILLLLQLVIYYRRNEKVKSDSGRKYVFGKIMSKEDNVDFDFILSLVPLYMIKNMPFQMKVKIKKTNLKLNIKDFADALLEHGKDTSIDVNSKDAVIRFRIA